MRTSPSHRSWLAIRFLGWASVFALLPGGSAQASTLAKLADLGQYLFVSSHTSATVTIVDSSTDRVIEHLSLPWAADELLIAERARAIVARRADTAFIYVQALDDKRTATRIPLPFAPQRMRMSPDGDTLTVASADEAAIALISLRDGTVRRTEPVHRPAFLLFDREGDQLLVASEDGSRMSVIDPTSAKVTKEVSLAGGDTPLGAAADFARTPGGQLGFVLHAGDNLISVLDLQRLEKQGEIELDATPRGIYPTINSQYVIVPTGADGRMSFISTWTLALSWNLPGAKDFTDAGTARFDTIAFLVDATHNELIAYDMDYERIAARIKLPGTPAQSAVAANGLKIYVALTAPDRVAVIDAETLQLVGLIDGVASDSTRLAMVNDLSFCH